jgi:hypothetical protein
LPGLAASCRPLLLVHVHCHSSLCQRSPAQLLSPLLFSLLLLLCCCAQACHPVDLHAAVDFCMLGSSAGSTPRNCPAGSNSAALLVS